jgi:hypothetical protein
MNERRWPLWRMVFLMISALALGALILAAACGGDDDDDDGGGDDGNTSTATASSENGGEETGQPTDGGSEPTDGDGDVLSDIEDFASEYENATGAVTYTLSGDELGDSGTWTIYAEGDNSRVDFEVTDGSFISITTPDATYTCTESGGSGFCFEGAGGIGENPFGGLFTAFASYDAVINYLDLFTDVDADSSSEEIAGVDANCYTLDGDFTGDEGTIKWCWSDSGLLLLASYDLDSGLFEMRATEYSEDVPGDAFDPPYDVTSFGQ